MKISILSVLVLLGSLLAQPTWAASQDECKIWLCLPSGFGPAACSGAYDAMIDRITPPDPESPLPPFSECTKDGSGGGMSTAEGRGAKLHAFEKCDSWGTRAVSGDDFERYCRRSTSVPEKKIAGTTCGALDHDVSGSGSYYDPVQERTCTSYKTIGVMVDGELKGEPYFYQAYDRREIPVE